MTFGAERPKPFVRGLEDKLLGDGSIGAAIVDDGVPMMLHLPSPSTKVAESEQYGEPACLSPAAHANYKMLTVRFFLHC